MTPSTEKQRVFANYLKEELISEGLQDVELDELGYLYATLPANTNKPVPTIGFIAHMDTSPDASGAHVKPRIVENYDGTDITLAEGIVTSVEKFPELLNHKGEDIIVTDGTTLLGADDKAGIAEIVTACEYLIQHPEIKHGKIRIGFTPDEEVGGLARNLDLDRFGSKVAYTLDGDYLGYYEDETFNASQADFEIHGISVHTGTAKGIMKNANRIAAQLIDSLPQTDLPETTQGRQGFYHVVSVSSTVENAHVTMIVRDHDADKFADRENFLRSRAQELNRQYGPGTVELTITPTYRNMKEIIDTVPYLIDHLKAAIRKAGIEPKSVAFRGGTDGSALSWRGLPSPNLSAGYENAHGRFEYVPIQSMEKNVEILLNLVQEFAK